MNSKQKIKSKRKCEWLVDLIISGKKDSDEKCDWKKIIAGIIKAIKAFNGVVEGLINIGMSYLIPSSSSILYLLNYSFCFLNTYRNSMWALI